MKSALNALALLPLCIGFLCISAVAATPQKIVEFNRVEKTPPEISALVPSRSKKIMSGSMKIGYQGTDVFIHVHSFGLRTLKSNSEEKNVEAGRLELFQQKRIKNRTVTSKINSIKIENAGDIVSSLHGRWLNTKQKSTPILFIQQRYWGGFAYAWQMLIFNRGLEQKPIMQKFDEYNSIGHSGRSISFDQEDERGFLAVKIAEYEGGMEPSPSDTHHEEILYWNGKAFAPRCKIDKEKLQQR